ncbi:MAG: BT_3928 family protein [Bacteroidota bacterium]
MKFLRNFSRILIGLTFIFSGFVKAVDPMGSMYKFKEYFEAFGMSGLAGMALFLGVLLFLCEFILGFSFLFNVKIKVTAWLMLLFMTFFTVLTFILAIKNPVSDCGCFGDAIKLTNWGTFYKNIVLMALTLIVFFQRKKFVNKFADVVQLSVLGLGAIIVLGIGYYSYNHLPLIDFMPWKKGAVIAKQILPQNEIAEIKLIYKNTETGEMLEYTSKTLPWQDTVFFKKLVFVEQKKKIIQEYKEAPIHDFMIDDADKNERNAEIIGNPNYQFLFISHDLGSADKSIFPALNEFYAQCRKDSISMVGLCGSSFRDIDIFRLENKANFDFFTVDETALKSVVRSNPGLVLLKNGVVLDKWHYHDFPTYEQFKSNMPKYEELLKQVKAKK